MSETNTSSVARFRESKVSCCVCGQSLVIGHGRPVRALRPGIAQRLRLEVPRPVEDTELVCKTCIARLRVAYMLERLESDRGALSALEADNRGKVVSSPRVITADKKKAIISQGEQIPYQTAAASGATTIAFRDAVLELSVTPRITPDDKIIMDLEVKKDSVGSRIVQGTPSIDTKRVNTQVLCDNGDTIVLGGIFEQTTRTTIEKVPVLGDIPLVGHLFKRTSRQDDKTELLIFVTPKIVKDTLTIR